MRKTLFQILIVAILIIIAIFINFLLTKFSDPQNNSNVPEKVMQIYSGTIPCADCEGIQTEISFVRKTNSKEISGEYALTEVYLGKHKTPITTEGVWQALILPTGETKIIINKNQEPVYFLLEPESILMLDQSGNVIDSKLNYRLQRI